MTNPYGIFPPLREHLLILLACVWNSSLYKNAFFLTLNNVATSLLGFVFWNIMTRVYTPAQVGIGSTLVASSGFVAMLANMGLGIGLIRFLPETNDKAIRLINSVFTISGTSALVGALCYLVCIKMLSPALGFLRDSLLFAVLYVLFTIATSLSIQTDNSMIAGRAGIYVFLKNVLISVFKIFFAVFVFKSFLGFGIFVSTGLGVVLGIFLAWVVFLPRTYKGIYLRPILEKCIIRTIMPYSFANFAGTLLGQVPTFFYPLIVLNVLGPEESAYFWIAWMMTVVLGIIPSGLSQSLFAEGSHDSQKISQNGLRVLILSLALTIPAAGLMIIFGNWLMVFFGPEYAEHGTILLQFLSISVIPQCINTIFITVNQVRKKVFLIVVQTGVSAVIALGLGYWMIGEMGLKGIGIAYVLANLCVAAAVVWPLLRVLNERQASLVGGEKDKLNLEITCK